MERRLVLSLYEPDIAANAGAMFRTCACFGADAAIIEPAGFVFSDKRFRRAGMDYLDALRIDRHVSFAAFEDWRAREGRRLVAADDERRRSICGISAFARTTW